MNQLIAVALGGALWRSGAVFNVLGTLPLAGPGFSLWYLGR